MPASGKILNTNMGLGFQRGRKYDTDMDRLGRIDTAQGELRKGLRGFNLQKELKKESMRKTYSVKRFSAIRQKDYSIMSGIGEGAKQATGSALETGGKLLDNGLTKTAAGVAGLGAMSTGAAIGSTVGSVLGPAGTLIGGTLGGLATPFVAAKGVETAGKALKTAGQEMKT